MPTPRQALGVAATTILLGLSVPLMMLVSQNEADRMNKWCEARGYPSGYATKYGSFCRDPGRPDVSTYMVERRRDRAWDYAE